MMNTTKKQPILLVLKGLIGAGKSTHAKELVKKGWKRVNKDLMREMVDGGQWSRKNEGNILASEKMLAAEFLRQGFNVVVDDCNFAHEETWQRIAKDGGAQYEMKFFDVPLLECIERDTKRGEKAIGAKNVYRMYEQYLKPTEPEYSDDKQNCYIFDIDGTLAKSTGRSPYEYSLVHTDRPNHNITMICRLLAMSGLPIIILSGRTDDCMDVTKKWLTDNAIPFDSIYMRKTGDIRRDSIVKKEIYEREIRDKYNVLAVFDDRNQVVEMWRSLGLTCLQVDWGFF